MNNILDQEDIPACVCGKPAVWEYMPGHEDPLHDFRCEECVPRGCACEPNELFMQMCEAAQKDSLPMDTAPDFNAEKYGARDKDGKILPCCEWAQLDWEDHVAVAPESGGSK